ncbi:glucosaminidase domain-containing protein [Neobacillus sp. LXY-4]|uniref:glucosaminidase domain-containing protein n=1 Tax=Neobacillus sp. LXY-4 TaxID=3379826 RepID=UPI003EE22EAB
MSFSPINTDWFKNMALLSISKSLSLKNNETNPLPQGEMFETMMQVFLGDQANLTMKQPETLEGNFFSLPSPILQNIKDTNISSTKTSLDYSDVSLSKLNSTLKGKLSSMGEHFIKAGRKYNINPNLLASIAIHETGNGKSRAAVEKLNIAGMMGKNGLKQYHSVEESIYDMARNLRENYLSQGKDTIAKIGAKYAPIGAGNDPTGLNNHWVKGVNNYFHSFIS